MTNSADWMDRPLADIAESLRSGDVAAKTLADEATARHRRWDGELHAYKAWDDNFLSRQVAAADAAFDIGTDMGPLHGIPVSVKDIYGVTGYPTHAGSPNALPERFATDGPLVANVRRQLGVITGKTHTVEFAYGGLGTNDHWGTPRNPWDADTHRVPGGSSAGAGVSLIEGSALMAFGTDTGGSVRVPASLTGTVGLKTTAGRWSTDGIVPLSTTLDTAGILTRTVADLAYCFAALDQTATEIQRPAEISGLRIGTTKDYFYDDCQDNIADVVAAALKELEAAGARLIDMEIPEAQQALETLAAGAIVAAEGHAHLKAEIPEWIETLQPAVGTRMADGTKVSAVDYIAALRRMDELNRAVTERLKAVDVLAVPTIPIGPATLQEVADIETYRVKNLATLHNTTAGNVLGLCAITLPAGLDKAGLPVGLQLIARPGDEERLVAVALAVEGVLGTSAQRLGKPPLGGA